MPETGCAACHGTPTWAIRWRRPFEPSTRRRACDHHLAGILAAVPADIVHLTRVCTGGRR